VKKIGLKFLLLIVWAGFLAFNSLVLFPVIGWFILITAFGSGWLAGETYQYIDNLE